MPTDHKQALWTQILKKWFQAKKSEIFHPPPAGTHCTVLCTRSASSLFALVHIFLCHNLLSMWLVGQWFGDATSARKRKEREEKYEGTFSARNWIFLLFQAIWHEYECRLDVVGLIHNSTETRPSLFIFNYGCSPIIKLIFDVHRAASYLWKFLAPLFISSSLKD